MALHLDDNSVHIWQADLDVLGTQRPDMEAHLDHAERERAAHFRRPLDRARFIASRGQLRELLALCLGVPPANLTIAYTPHGKPFLPNCSHCHFNIAHTKNFALWAISYHSEIGIDIEQISPSIPLETLTSRVLCENERHLLHQHEPDPLPLFLQLWTRKEAFLKANGCGLSIPLPQIDTSAPNNQISLLNPHTNQWEGTAWFFRSLFTFPHCIAALVSRNQNHKLIQHEL